VDFAAAAKIHCLALPTPFAVGTVNVYLIEDEPLTLVDCGPASTESLDAFDVQLRALGHSIADLELLLVTHEHVDHLGLTRHLAAASGAEVACLNELATYAESFSEHASTDDRSAAELMRLHGVPHDVVAALERVAPLARSWGSSFTTTRRLSASSEIELRDRTLKVVHAPGHSPTDTLFLDETNELVFVGDHLLAKISSNALISPAAEPVVADGRPPRRRALIEYMASLRATRELPVSLVLGGHGDPIRDHKALIDRRLGEYDVRATKILSVIRARPRTAHEIAEFMWGAVAVTQAFLTLSEVLGHIDLLIDDNLVHEEDSGETVLFSPVG
jgi:glyoxylase-like metal-dependent hydrolase (beta-lactamase superfamily II)